MALQAAIAVDDSDGRRLATLAAVSLSAELVHPDAARSACPKAAANHGAVR